MTLEFLSADTARATAAFAPVSRSPMERCLRDAGARFEIRDGWNTAVAFASVEQEREIAQRAVGWADSSHLGKLEIQAAPADLAATTSQVSGGAQLELGRASRRAGAWWCPLSPARVLVVCDPGRLPGLRERLVDAAASAAGPAGVVDVTTVFAAMTLVGPQARETFARFCALDLRPSVTPLAALRPGSIARQPGVLIREAEDRFLILFGWAIGQYMWTVVDDAGRHLDGAPVGADALEGLGEPIEELSSHA